MTAPKIPYPGICCPHCSHPKTKVVDSRPTKTSILRRRRCLECNYRWITYEHPTDVGKFVAQIKAAAAKCDAATADLMKALKEYKR